CARPPAASAPRARRARWSSPHAQSRNGRVLRRAEQSARAVEARAVPACEALDADAGAGVRRVDEAAVPDVHADVAVAVEEDEVAGTEAPPADAAAPHDLGIARMGERHAEMRVDVADEAGAVEAAR